MAVRRRHGGTLRSVQQLCQARPPGGGQRTLGGGEMDVMRVRHQAAVATRGREPPPQALLRARVQRAAARETADGRFGVVHGRPVCAGRFYTALPAGAMWNNTPAFPAAA